MARNFRRHRSAHPIADLNVTNLIDLGFILLVIFMIATPLIQHEQTVPVNLPTVSKGPPSKADPNEKFVTVGVDAKGFYVDNKIPLTLAEVRTRLRALAAQPRQPVVRIRGDAKVPYERVAELINEVQNSGLSRTNFDLQTER